MANLGTKCCPHLCRQLSQVRLGWRDTAATGLFAHTGDENQQKHRREPANENVVQRRQVVVEFRAKTGTDSEVLRSAPTRPPVWRQKIWIRLITEQAPSDCLIACNDYAYLASGTFSCICWVCGVFGCLELQLEDGWLYQRIIAASKYTGNHLRCDEHKQIESSCRIEVLSDTPNTCVSNGRTDANLELQECEIYPCSTQHETTVGVSNALNCPHWGFRVLCC